MTKSKSAVTGKYVSKKTAKADPKTTFAASDYPTRALRKLCRIWESEDVGAVEFDDAVAAIKKRMGWK